MSEITPFEFGLIADLISAHFADFVKILEQVNIDEAETEAEIIVQHLERLAGRN